MDLVHLVILMKVYPSYKTWFPEDKLNSENVFSNTLVKSIDIKNGTATHLNIETNKNKFKVSVDKVILSAGSQTHQKYYLIVVTK